jgi:hypothetical protein
MLFVVGCSIPLREVAPSQSFAANDKDAIVLVRVTPAAAVIIESGEVDEHGFRGDNFAPRKQFGSQDGYAILKVPPTEGIDCYGIVAVRPEHFTPLAEERPFTFATVAWHKSIFKHPIVVFAAVLVPIVGAIPAGVVAASALETDFRNPDEKGRFAYSPREGVDLPVFKAVAGEVTYIGGLRIDASRREGSTASPKRIAITPIVSPEDTDAAAGFMATHFPNIHMDVTFRPFQMAPRDELGDN